MPINYDGESHILYQRGLSAGLEKSEQLIEQEREKIARLEQKFEKFEQAFEEERAKSKRAEEEANRVNEEIRLNTIMGIKQLLELGNLEVKQIASIMSVDIQFVEQIKSGEIS